MIDRALVLGLVAGAAACGGAGDTSSDATPAEPVIEATIETGGGAEAPRFVDLGGPEPDLVLAAPSRLQLDVVAREDGAWGLYGSSYSGKTPALRIAAGSVSERTVIAVLQGDGEVTLLSQAPAQAHRLGPPVRLAGDGAPEGGIALGDLDGDGSDELLLARESDLEIVSELVKALDADPEKPPNLRRATLATEIVPGALAVLPSGDDGPPAALVLDRSGPHARIFQYIDLDSGPKATAAAWIDVALPARGASITASYCPGWLAFVTLETGVVVALSADEPGVVAELSLPPAVALASSSRALAVASGDHVAISLRSTCALPGVDVAQTSGIADLAIEPAGAGAARVAIVPPGGAEVQLLRVGLE